MEQKDSTALLPCAFILINSQITVGPLLIFLTFFSLFFLSVDSPRGIGHIALQRNRGGYLGYSLFAKCPEGPRLSDQRGTWSISSWHPTNIDKGLSCVCMINQSATLKGLHSFLWRNTFFFSGSRRERGSAPVQSCVQQRFHAVRIRSRNNSYYIRNIAGKANAVFGSGALLLSIHLSVLIACCHNNTSFGNSQDISWTFKLYVRCLPLCILLDKCNM